MNWVDPATYGLQDKPYAYTGSYYENDPTSRLDKSSGPGEQFNASSSYTPQYRYGQYENLPNSANQAAEITPLLNNILPSDTTAQIENLFTTQVSQIALNNTSTLTNVSVSEFTGQGGISLSLDPLKNYILSNTTYQIGAQTGQNGMPISTLRQYNLPNVYDNSGNTSSSDALKFQLQTEVTPLGQVTYGSSPDQGEARSYYDAGGLLRFTQDADQAAAGVCLSYLYDGNGRLTQIYGITLTTWEVSTLQGYLGGQKPSQAQLIRQYTYDTLPQANSVSPISNTQGRLVKAESWNITSGLAANPNSYVGEVYTYDDLGNLINTQVTYGTNNPYTLIYTYTESGQLASVTYPSTLDSAGTVSGVVYTYDTQGRITQVGRLNADGSVIPDFYASYGYTSEGPLGAEVLNQGLFGRFFQYNILNQLIKISDSQNYFTETLSYADSNGNYQDGNIQQANYSFAYGTPNATNYTYNYSYDSFGRLTSAQANTSVMPSWQITTLGSGGNYDANGNVYAVNLSGTSFSYTYTPGTDQLLTRGDTNATYSYSSSGRVNQIMPSTEDPTAFTYNIYTPRAVLVGQTQLMYNRKGERIFKQSPNMTIQYYRQGAQALQESVAYTDSGNTYQLSYIYGPTGLIAIEVNQTSGTNNSSYDGTYFMVKDDLGSIRAIYNASTNQIAAYINYSPWGAIVTDNSSLGVGEESDANIASLFRYLYTGQEYDPDMGLYNYHARQYDPTLGRYLTPDPAHQTPSPYLYCANNPINDTDPTGDVLIIEGASFARRQAIFQSLQQLVGNNNILLSNENNEISFSILNRDHTQFPRSNNLLESIINNQRTVRIRYTQGAEPLTSSATFSNDITIDFDPERPVYAWVWNSTGRYLSY